MPDGRFRVVDDLSRCQIDGLQMGCNPFQTGLRKSKQDAVGPHVTAKQSGNGVFFSRSPNLSQIQSLLTLVDSICQRCNLGFPRYPTSSGERPCGPVLTAARRRMFGGWATDQSRAQCCVSGVSVIPLADLSERSGRRHRQRSSVDRHGRAPERPRRYGRACWRVRSPACCGGAVSIPSRSMSHRPRIAAPDNASRAQFSDEKELKRIEALINVWGAEVLKLPRDID